VVFLLFVVRIVVVRGEVEAKREGIEGEEKDNDLQQL
jgi:hypothetical protein